MKNKTKKLSVQTPPQIEAEYYATAEMAVDRAIELYAEAVDFLNEKLASIGPDTIPTERFRAFYPEIRVKTVTYSKIDGRLAYGHVVKPGSYSTTVTQPQLYRRYLIEQLSLLVENHDVTVSVGNSKTAIPVHFAIDPSKDVLANIPLDFPLRDVFDVPDLDVTNDNIANGIELSDDEGAFPLSLFNAPRVDYSLARLSHYTATRPEHFQNYVLFTNYQFYVDEFEIYAREQLADPKSGYVSFVGPGNAEISATDETMPTTKATPQMPSYHLKRADGNGVTLVNIGVGPSNAKTITDHIAVLRPHAWLMVGHCAGLRNSQTLGDFVLAHAYLREDHVLDDDLPTWIPIPPLAEVQIALEQAVAGVTKLEGFDLKRILRTGTVASVDNRNWELQNYEGPIQRLSQARAVALDMESAVIAANGFRFRVPYGTLLRVSDKPLHGELKLPGMATRFYDSNVSQHLEIGIRSMEILRDMPSARLHSRKLRSFEETPFR